MIVFIRNCLRIKSTIFLFFASIFCIALSGIRFLVAQDIFLLFLGWNLLLAFISWFIAIALYTLHIKYKIVIVISLFIWLLFFPNAPYILTDLIHLRRSASLYVWLDFVLLLSYGLTGLLYGYTGLQFIETICRTRLNIKHPLFFPVFVLYLSGYGIYLGRFLRWNSWDIFINMHGLFYDIGNHLRHPLVHKHVWIFSFLMGTVLVGLYCAFKIFRLEPEKPHKPFP